jgi:hypothetical protein
VKYRERSGYEGKLTKYATVQSLTCSLAFEGSCLLIESSFFGNFNIMTAMGTKGKRIETKAPECLSILFFSFGQMEGKIVTFLATAEFVVNAAF